MNFSQNWFRLLRPALNVLALAALWFIFAPLQIGGQTTYLILTGNSMEPRFQWGDLVMVRSVPRYKIEDIVAYEHPQLGPVFHRIIQHDGEKYFLKGDNNTWVDGHQPTGGEIIGKLWLHLPFVGQYLNIIRSPEVMPLFAVGISMAVVMVLFTGKKKHEYRPSGKLSQNWNSPMIYQKEYFREVISFLILIGLVSLAGVFFSFSRPLSQMVSDPLPYSQSGIYDYTAQVPSGVYDQDVVSAGEPLFFQVVNAFTINFSYQFEGPSDEVFGTYQLIAEVSEPGGWKQKIQLHPIKNFAGTSFSTSGIVQISDVRQLIDELESQTGFQRTQYFLTIHPQVAVAGRVDDVVFQDEFNPALVFNFDDIRAWINTEETSTLEEILEPSSSGDIMKTTDEVGTLSLLGFELPVWIARVLSVTGVVLA
ncbi:MAG: signal peptidase I, partial [Chloroflexi bacterium]|nr:signal peptidase I [Chloroflexota bacterium]